MQYVLLGLVLAIITSSVAAWMKMTGGDDGVAEAELVDFGDFDVLPLPNDFPARHAMVTVASRHIPLIFVTRGPRLGQAWLHFADGTELLAEERVLGALGFLAFDLAWPNTAELRKTLLLARTDADHLARAPHECVAQRRLLGVRRATRHAAEAAGRASPAGSPARLIRRSAPTSRALATYE